MQKARRSSIQSTKTYKAFQTFQSFMTFSPTGITTCSSTLQYNPVPSSTIQCIQGFHPFQHFFNQNANSTHRLVSTRNSIEYQSNTRQYILQTFHSSKKGRCCDMSQYDTIGKIELIPAFVLSTDKTNC